MKKAVYFIKKLLLLFTVVFSVPVAVYLVSQQTQFNSRASGSTASLVVNSSLTTLRTSYNWKNIAQGGEEKLEGKTMLTPVLSNLKKLSPQHIRIDHVYDFYDVVSKNSDRSLVFNWTKLDQIVSEINSVGAKPFFSLSFDDSWSFSEWQRIVAKTVERYSGEKRIENVYYEIGNEPDLFGGWKVGGGKNYLDLYFYAASGARNAKNTLDYKIGGPATTALYRNWYLPLLDFVRSQTLRMDFYSWHRYSFDLQQFEKDISQASFWREEAANRFSDIEFIISEAGPNSEVDSVYDNTLSAIHLLAVVALTDGNVDKLFTFEAKDGPGGAQLWGRWGILTHEKFGNPIEKDRFKALEFLNLMEGSRVQVVGQGSWVKAFGSQIAGSTKVLIVNYDVRGRHSEAVPIEFNNLIPGSYTIKRQNFLGATTRKTVQADQGNLKVYEYFAPNTAAILELIPN